MLNKRFSSPLAQGILLVGAMVASLVGVTLLAALCAPLFGLSFAEVSSGRATADNLALSRYLLAVNSIGQFLLPPFLAAMLIAPRRANVLLGTRRKPLFINVLRSLFVMVAAVPFISLASSVNELIPLPVWAKEMEEVAARLTEQVLLVGDAQSFMLNLLVMALLPALGEEVFFRGYVQRVLRDWVGNPHLAIFASALFFSAFHLQFAGFIPRFLMGAALGYLFYWSGSLWLSIAAHFANNAIAVCAYFYITRHSIPVDMEQVDAAIQGTSLSALLSIAMTGYFLYGVFITEKLRRKMQLIRKRMGGGGVTPII